jgi:hypothetical protein
LDDSRISQDGCGTSTECCHFGGIKDSQRGNGIGAQGADGVSWEIHLRLWEGVVAGLRKSRFFDFAQDDKSRRKFENDTLRFYISAMYM